jgi:hypothetical protein
MAWLAGVRTADDGEAVTGDSETDQNFEARSPFSLWCSKLFGAQQYSISIGSMHHFLTPNWEDDMSRKFATIGLVSILSGSLAIASSVANTYFTRQSVVHAPMSHLPGGGSSFHPLSLAGLHPPGEGGFHRPEEGGYYPIGLSGLHIARKGCPAIPKLEVVRKQEPHFLC